MTTIPWGFMYSLCAVTGVMRADSSDAFSFLSLRGACAAQEGRSAQRSCRSYPMDSR